MNKKILMSGVAALLISGGMHATTASASALSYSHSGEATLTATFSDTCATAADTLATDPTTSVTGSFADFLGIDYTPDDDDGDGGVADQIEQGLDAINGFVNVVDDDEALTGVEISFAVDPCGGASADNPVWATTSKLDWAASGTLANGLSVSVDQDAAITLGGAFGTLEWKSGGDSAVKAAHVGGDGDIKVAGGGFGGHALATDGTAGYVINYTAPTMGGLGLFVSYAPGSAATNTDAYLDTIAIGASMSAGDLSFSAGFENASKNANASSSPACDHGIMTVEADDTFTAEALIDDVYGTDECGDQSLVVIGASMSAGGISISGGYSNLDTEEADRATTSIDLSTSAGDWNLGLGYTTATKSSKIAGADTTQTAIGATLGTALGDGVDLTIKMSNNEYDSSAQATSRGGNGATSDFQAIGELKITY